ncbi:hypothetical protein BASA81_007553 [Batrachochytrium salamandrivorans]|nr:hypothetical protein BASA81_007553 [Batrachochytrium salamandrivorans]
MEYLCLASSEEESALFGERWTLMKTRRHSHLVFSLLLCLALPVILKAEYWAWEMSLLLLGFPLLLSLPYRLIVVTCSLVWPLLLGLRIVLSPLPYAYWFAIPLNLGAYSGPPLPGLRIGFAIRFAVALLCLVRTASPGDALGFLLCQFLVLRKLYRIASKERGEFLQARRTHTAQEQLANTEGTLVRNAMRLAFPENPFHNKATEERIERMKHQLQVTNRYDIGQGLKPLSLPVPRHFSTKLRCCKIARYTYQTEQVLVQSVPNLEMLESELDLEWFVCAVQQASVLPKLPGLMKTLGFCLSPCTFVVEELIDLHSVTLRDLVLELSAENLQLDWCFVRPLLADLAGTLVKMHSSGVLHRRVSISTVLLTSKTSVALFPCTFHHAFPEVRKKFWGSPLLWDVAPEAQLSPLEFTEAADVWAFCVLAWELLVGPFTNHVTHFAMPPSVPKTVVDSIIDGLSPRPDGRPSMVELLQALSTDRAGSEEDNSVSKPVFDRVLQRLNAIPGKPLAHVESARSLKPNNGGNKNIRVSFVDGNEGEELL